MKKTSIFLSVKAAISPRLFAGILIGIMATFAFQKIPFSSKLASSAVVANASGPAPVCGLTQMPFNNNVFGLTVTADEYQMLTTAYQNEHPNTGIGVTWGGVIGKNQLIAVINSLGTEATEVNFKFITNQENKKTSIIFQGGTTNPVNGDPGNPKLYMRTGTAGDAFCPTRCQ